jgi:uncharacterized membrane protein
MSLWPIQATVYFQYMAPVIPFMNIGAIFGLYRLAGTTGLHPVPNQPLKARPGRGIALWLSAMLFSVVASWTYQNPITGRAVVSSLSFRKSAHREERAWKDVRTSVIQPNDAAIREGLKRVPEGVPVLTTSNYMPHLSHRAEIRNVRRTPVPALVPGVEAIFVNLKDLRNRSCDDYFDNLQIAAGAGFGVTFYRDGVVLVEKGKGNVGQLRELISNWPGCG